MDERQRLIAADFDMSFLKKVGFTIKREVTAVPAALILIITGFILMGFIERIILNP
jgi:hypothetical protein